MLRTSTLLLGLASLAAAQAPDTTSRARPLAAITVTATRTERTTFDTPLPVTVLDSARLAQSLANGAADLFQGLAGLDLSGVGPNQRRPEIRGQRGQRILLLGDGLRLNNARRQQDFGELPALAGVAPVERVEVVRGPSSVLYGTDAIGGVVNFISASIPRSQPSGVVRGAVRYRYGGAGASSTPDLMLATRVGKLGVRVDGGHRNAAAYTAPAGTFGNITLASDEPVYDSGVRDWSGRAALSWDLGGGSEVFARGEQYGARRAGFGWIDPARLGAGQPKIQIRYPDQDFARYTAGYRARALARGVADRAEVAVYTQHNTRHLAQYIQVPIGPGATVTTDAFNYTNLGTIGGRVELARSWGSRTLTYGVDAFRDRSRNTDSSKTVIAGFGPPITRTKNVPSVPNATFSSAGAFAQLELQPVSRLTTVVGTRVQSVSAKTEPTTGVTSPPLSGTDRTAVWSANALYQVTSGVNVLASAGRGFRAANLVERFFNGTVPEGNAYQKANPALTAETSLNVDAGVRLRRGVWYGEGFIFRNTVDGAIRAAATGNTVNGLPEYQNKNVGKLRVDGTELLAGARPLAALDGNVSYTRLLGKNISDPGSPIGDSYSSKVVGDVSYSLFRDRASLGYTVRHQGEQKDVIVGANPIGSVLPAFTVHSARAQVRLGRGTVRHRLTLAVDNIGNTLYAEFPNASFFRPEPGRSFTVAVASTF